MKKLLLFALTILLCSSISAQIPDKFTGNWDYTGPDCPYGYDSGLIIIQKDTVFTTYTDDYTTYHSDLVKLESDMLIYNMYVGVDIEVNLYLLDESTLKGNAIWSGGECTVTLVRSKVKE